MQRISPCLWFDTQAEEAANFYAGIFKNSKIKSVTHYGEAGPMPAGTVMVVAFELDGVEFIALNGGPIYKFSEAVSLSVGCRTQAEVDNYWNALTKGGEEGPCGWLKDKFGLSWQVVPLEFSELMGSSDAKRVKQMTEAMMTMKKLDLAKLKAAYNA
ncbi:MAG TPA: VOC family protein [Rhizomicrobium sp.]|jgi:predicted 3-demethylubiquinone-9 3-methyltransferase (glyoxalase superfamily)